MTEMTPFELDQLIYGDDEPDREEPAAEIPSAPEGGAGLAAWHMRKMVTIQDQAAFEDQAFKDQIAIMTARRRERAATHENAMAWHREPLQQWHRRERGAGRLDGKKLTLPTGSAQLRAAKNIDIQDEDAIRAYAETKVEADPETGEKSTWADHIFRQTETFMISELTSRAKIPAKKGGREPGSVADLLDADGNKVPGVRAIILPDTWSVSAPK